VEETINLKIWGEQGRLNPKKGGGGGVLEKGGGCSPQKKSSVGLEGLGGRIGGIE